MMRSRYPVPRLPGSRQSPAVPNEKPPAKTGICRDDADVIREEHFFVDERCFHCGREEET